MKLCLLSLLLLLAGTSAAQTIPASLPATVGSIASTPPLTAADTVRALHKLFKSRRQGGALLISGAAALTLMSGATAAATETEKGLFEPTPAEYTALTAILTSPALVVGFVKATRFSPRRERLAVEQYELHKTLSPALRKRLTGKYFHQ